jgi:HPt (histidine-containing phosphotransfer) domain-containing protein
MTDLKAHYRKALPARIAALEAGRGPMAAGAAEAWTEVRRLAHSLRGSGGTYGFPEVTEAARLLEDAPESDRPRQLEQLLEVLRKVAAGGS